MSNEEWKSRALCREVDPELFYPEGPANTIHARYREAVSICQRCDVRAECYQYAWDNNERDGIWGGHYASNIYRAKRKKVGL